MTKKHLLKVSISLMCFSIAILSINFSFGQTQSIITPTGLTPSQLNSDQLAKFNRLSGSTLHDNFQIVEVRSLSASQVNGQVRLALANLPCTDMIFTATKVQYTSENDYYWYGIINSSDEDNPCKSGVLTLMAKGGEKFGAVVFDDHSYEFQDLGNGIQAFSRFKLEAVDENECRVGAGGSLSGISSQPLSNSSTQQNAPSVNSVLPCAENCETRVLVLWTQAAANIEANINNRIALAIAETNQAYLNSQVGGTLNLVLAGSQQINFNESGNNMVGDVGRLAGMADIQALRNAQQADIVVLLTNGNYGAYAGATPEVGPNFNLAYAIVQTNSATAGRFTFAHEVGHLFGARHDIDPTGTIEHGYVFGTGFLNIKQRHTLVTFNPKGKTREQNYSNPDVKIKNKPTGTALRNNNAQLHRNTGCTVANFFANPQVMTVGMSLDNSAGTSVRAEAIVTCGTAPFNFNWRYSYDGINWQPLPNAEIVNFNIDCNRTSLTVELTVTENNNEQRSTSRTISVGRPDIYSGFYTYTNYPYGSPMGLVELSGGEDNEVCYTVRPTVMNTIMDIRRATNVQWFKDYSNPALLTWAQSGNNLSISFKGINQTGDFYVQASNGCGLSSKWYTFKSVSCGGSTVMANNLNIEEVRTTISPNPASNNIMITTNSFGSLNVGNSSGKLITEVRLYDIVGRLKTTQRFGNVTSASLSISDLQNGLYFVEIYSSNGKELKTLKVLR